MWSEERMVYRTGKRTRNTTTYQMRSEWFGGQERELITLLDPSLHTAYLSLFCCDTL
jgi:hypothetical protein